MGPDDVCKEQHHKPPHLWPTAIEFRQVRYYELAACLVFCVILIGLITWPAAVIAAEGLPDDYTLPETTSVLISPLSMVTAASAHSHSLAQATCGSLGEAGRWTRNQSWMLAIAGGLVGWAVVGAALLLVAILLFIHFRRRQRTAPTPSRTTSIPYLKSADDSLYFRLEGLDQDGVIIGRGKHGVDHRIEESTLHADTVSNKHARIFYDAASGYVVIEDLGSTNGIFINGRQAPRRNLLKDTWVVGLGKVTMTYHDGEADTGPLD